MFKMGCSMAKKILAIDGKERGAGSQTDGAASCSSSSKRVNKDKQQLEPPGSVMKSKTSGDELGDFSKLEQDPRIPLNVRQIFKITKSWKAIARTMSKTGTAMFLNLFEQNQDLFYLFDRFQHLKGKELHDSMELREHASTVMSTLDQSINSLSDYDNFVAYLHSIGKLHRKVPGFKREHFWKIEQPFLKAVKQTLDERCNETIEEIYKIAIKLIIETIADGYGDDDPQQQQQSAGAQQAGGGGGAGASDGAARRNAQRDTSDGQSSAPAGQQQQQQQQPSANNNAAPAASGAPRQRSSGDPNQEPPADKATDAPPSRRAGTMAAGGLAELARGHAHGQAEEAAAAEAARRLKGTLFVLRELLLLLTQKRKNERGSSQATAEAKRESGEAETATRQAAHTTREAPRCINCGINRNNNQDDEQNEFVAAAAPAPAAAPAAGAINESAAPAARRLIACCTLERADNSAPNCNKPEPRVGEQSSSGPQRPPLSSRAPAQANVLRRRPLCISEFVNKNNNINSSTQSGLKEKQEREREQEQEELQPRVPTAFSTMIPRSQVHANDDDNRRRCCSSPRTQRPRQRRAAPSLTPASKRQALSTAPNNNESSCRPGTGTGGAAGAGAQHERSAARVCDNAANGLNSTLGAQQTLLPLPAPSSTKPLDTLSPAELTEFDERPQPARARPEPSRGPRVLSVARLWRRLVKPASSSSAWQLARAKPASEARQTNDSAPRAAARDGEGLLATEAKSRPKQPLGPVTTTTTTTTTTQAAPAEHTLHNVLLTTNLGDLSELIKMLMLTVASHTHKGKTITSDTSSKDTSTSSKSKKNIIKCSGNH